MPKFSHIFNDCTKLGKKIPKLEYLDYGKTAIIDQSKKYISGYSNLQDGIFKDVPAIIFGDHTRIFKYVDQPFFLGADGVKLLKAKDNTANYKYLFYALQGVNLPNLGYSRHFSVLKKSDVVIHDRIKQDHIVKVLDLITSIISKRKEQLQNLNDLIRSQFIEMFGREGKYPLRELSEITEIIAGGDKPRDHSDVKTDEYCFPVYANGVENEGLQCYVKNYRVNKEAVTISARGTIGATFLRQPFFTPVVRLITLIPNEQIDATYLKYAIDFIGVSGNGTSQQQLTVPNVSKVKIPIPKMEQQKKYATFVNQIDKSKVAIQKSIDESQLLFNSLMHRYFGKNDNLIDF